MREVLVTGGAGFIGCNFVRRLLAERPAVRVTVLDALTYAGSRENLRDVPEAADQRLGFVHGDVCDRELLDRLFGEHDIDTVVHFAAESHVDRSITGPGAFITTNVVGTFHLLEAARAAWLGGAGRGAADGRRFHQVLTDEVFGSLGPGDAPFCETTAYDPRSPYSASKAASDHLVRAYHHTYGLPVTLSNCSNNYGPYQFPEKLIPLVLFNALRGKPLPIYGDGQQVRDWLYVLDHCDGLLAVIERGQLGQTYNFGGGNQPTNLALVETLCDLLDERFPGSPHRPHRQLITFVEDRPGHDRRYAMDCARAERELGWRPSVSLTQGLRRTVDWYAGAGAWLGAIRQTDDYQRWIEQNYVRRA